MPAALFLNAAIRIALDAHADQTDKAGLPYILHPLRVMLMMEDEPCRIVAVMHDVAEDCEHGWQDIDEAGFDDEILNAIDAVTRREGEAYFDYVRRAGANEIGKIVKLADLKDNLSPERRKSITSALVDRYEKAQRILGEM